MPLLARLNPSRPPFLIWELPLAGGEHPPAPPVVDEPIVRSA
jgi:hypothetical protein